MKGEKTSKILEMIIQKVVDLNGLRAKYLHRTGPQDYEACFLNEFKKNA